MHFGSYSLGAVVLGAIALAVLLAILLRSRSVARSKPTSVVPTRRSKSRSADDGALATRSLAEMLHYYAPHQPASAAETPREQAAPSEMTTRSPGAAKSVIQPVSDTDKTQLNHPPATVSVRIHSATVPAAPSGFDELQLLAPMPVAEPQRSSSESVDDSPSLVMGAPVEVWFEGARMGVKAGSETHGRFRKCADALLHDLKAARSDSR